METVSVRCNHCGAPLQIGADTRFVLCQFCQSQLEVRRSESAVFTEEVARIAESTGQMAENLKIIQLQNEIEQLDRDLGSGPGARERTGVASQVFIIAFGVFWVSCTLGMTGIFSKLDTGFAVLPFVMACFGIGVVGASVIRANRQNARLDAYQQKRFELEHQIAKARQAQGASPAGTADMPG